MPKSPDAFRTISEVADWLGIQAHVLRFWESKFTQVKPIKRAGGRRYYRPTDMSLLGGIKKLLHDDGLTIKGVQKILREEGMSHVSALSPPLDDADEIEITATTVTDPDVETTLAVVEPEEEKGIVLPFDAPSDDDEDVQKNIFEEDASEELVAADDTAPDTDDASNVETAAEASPEPEPEVQATIDPEAVQEALPEKGAEPIVETAPEPTPDPEPAVEAKADPEPEPLTASEPEPRIELEPFVDPAALAGGPADAEPAKTEEPLAAQADPEPEITIEPEAPPSVPDETDAAAEAPAPAGALPAFLRRPLGDPAQDAAQEDTKAETQDAVPEQKPVVPPAPKPRIVEVPEATPESAFAAAPAGLAAAYKAKALSKAQGAQAAPLLARLTVLRDSMAARRRNPPGTTTPD